MSPTHFRNPRNDPCFPGCSGHLRDNPKVTIVPPSQQLFEQGIELYSRRTDKAWSLTDCISFVVMREMGLSDVLTGRPPFRTGGVPHSPRPGHQRPVKDGSSMSVFLGIDIGTSGTKTLAINAHAARYWPPPWKPIPVMPQNPSGASRTPKIGGKPPSNLSAGWSSRASSSRPRSRPSVCQARCTARSSLDKNDKVIRRAILWNDQRTAAECRGDGRSRRRPAGVDQAGGQSGHDRIHRPENPLAAEPRAAEFCQDRRRYCCPRTRFAAA